MATHPPAADRKRVLVTGAAGRIGSAFAAYAASRYRLRLMVLPGETKAESIAAFGEVVKVDVSDREALAAAMTGVSACVHLAGDPRPTAVWDELLPNNIVGTYNVFAAAKAAGCARVVYASSIHAVSGYPAGVQVKTTEPPNPGSLYGVSKCFGEALGRYMAEQEGLSVIAVRIGAYQPAEHIEGDRGLTLIDSWVSPRDLNQLIARSIDAEDVKFAIVHGLSNNRFNRLDIGTTRELLGYQPEDDSSVTNAKVKPLDLPHARYEHSLKDSRDPQADSGLRNDLPPA